MSLTPETRGGITGLFFRIQSSSVLLGIVYLACFLVSLPWVLSLHIPIGNFGVLLLALLAGVVLATVFLNWIYAVVVAVPLLAAGVLFFGGWAVYIGSPLIMMAITGIVSTVSAAFGSVDPAITSVVDTVLKYFGSFLNHIGQAMITMGTAIWYHIRVLAAKTNAVAIGAFLLGVVLVGILAGFTGLTGVAMFLVVWFIIYVKIHGDPLNPTLDPAQAAMDLKRLFQVVATIIVLIGTGSVRGAFSAIMPPLQQVSSPFTSFLPSPVPAAPGWPAYLSLYQWLLTVLFLTGIWKPSLLTRFVPGKYRDYLERLIGNVLGRPNVS